MSTRTGPNREPGGPRTGSLAELRAELEAIGLRPTKTLGQNFLFDPNLARAIVADAGVRPGDRVLEVGPGCGFLTGPLCDLGVELLVVEIDPRLAELARRRVGESERVRWIVSDVLGGKRRLAPPVEEALWKEGDWHLVANLPYGVSGPLIAILAARANPPTSMSVLVQDEVAGRLVAEPGSRAFGALSVRIQLRYRARAGREVPAHLFWPKPRVASRIAHLELRTDLARVSPGVLDAFDRLVEACFQRRRKTLRSTLGTWLGDRDRGLQLLQEARIDPSLRPEVLGAEDFLALARGLVGDAPGPR